MRVSRGTKWSTPEDVKSVAVASNAETRALLSTGMRALGIPIRHHVRNLGVDYAPGRRRHKRNVQLSRWAKVRSKVKRGCRLGARAAATVGRTALAPAVTYGTACTGMPTGLLSGIRSAMASMHGPMRGRSVTARLALRRNDPVFPVVLAPLWAWWRAAWEGTLPDDILEAALKGATRAMETAGHLRHSALEGGAAAFLSSLERVRWKPVGPGRFLLANGTSFDLGGRW